MQGTGASRGQHEEAVEEYESIPWDALLDDRSEQRRRWVMIGAVAVAAMAIAASAARTLLPVGASPARQPSATEVQVTVPPTLPPATTTPAVRTEADLMAVDRHSMETLVAAHAAWFVADYFTVDGSGSSPAADRLPPDLAVGGEGLVSFVESVHPIAITQLQDERYAVSVAVRSIAARGDEGYRRQPVRVAEVVLEITEGGIRIIDLPRPLPVPTASIESWEPTLSPLPPSIAEGAREAASRWGVPRAEPVGGQVGDLWRAIVMVSDGLGGEWPIAVWLDPEGREVPAGR